MTDNAVTGESLPLRSRNRPAKKRGGWYFLRDIVVILFIAILASFLVKTFLVRSFYIPSGSMENTLQVNDRILVNELVPNLVSIKHGDVVVFRDPGGWLPVSPKVSKAPLAEAGDWLLSLVGLSSPDNNDHLIKRVIGLPGDVVECCNALGQLTVNGVPLDEPYVKLPPGTQSVSAVNFKQTVPEGMLWVMGDNRYDSKDSRYNLEGPTKGFVPIKNVVGRAFVISWPMDRWSGLGNYPEVFRGVERDSE
ncbi:signal peptidase I [Mycetocola spongiae]|uniref:signal peptidase I n=1 Tax=Mycetocola spongiae TaxID=2859226 RepID=UPI001CF279F7|nr:signal peptidase I [Mycetocola spongiae]UCR89202.1 signal peptidase I [Mycetocola spongiae]